MKQLVVKYTLIVLTVLCAIPSFISFLLFGIAIHDNKPIEDIFLWFISLTVLSILTTILFEQFNKYNTKDKALRTSCK